MCGIVGIAGDLELRDEETMRRLLWFDWIRGQDSTGLAAIRNSGDVRIAKNIGGPETLFQMLSFRSALNAGQSRVFIGHNRKATSGMVNNYNAHPFNFDHITGAHNGSLENSTVKALEDQIGEQFAVDSQTLLAAIAKLGIKETIKQCEGAWALAWYDNKEDTFNLFRNQDRPMWYAYTEDFKKLIYASEWWMIDAGARTSQGYKLYQDKKTTWQYFQIEPDVHYKWAIKDLRAGSKTMPKPKITTIKGKEAAPVTNVHPFVNTREQRYPSMTGPKTSGSRKSLRSMTTVGSGVRTNDRVTHVLGRREKPFGDMVTIDQFADMTRDGCAWCRQRVNWGEKGQTVIEKQNAVLCPVCSPDTDRNRVYTKIDYYLK